MIIRTDRIKHEDRTALARLLDNVTIFDEGDRGLALELVDTALNNPEQKDYDFILAYDEPGRLVGYACYGPTPLTQGTFDLYYIAVDDRIAGKGIGTALVRAMEGAMRARGGRLIVVETSSKPEYEKTRNFYIKNKYTLAETLRDFYQDGEDRVTYTKRLK